MISTFKLTIEYDGANYHGWQRQRGARTIQGEIEAALFTMTRQKITVTGSGRTDAGVHALAQVAGFQCDTRLSAENFQNGLNSLLDKDIVIRACEAAPDNFHARFDVKRKTYQYRILNRDLPAAVGRQYAWHISRPLDLAAMRRSLPPVTGEHDFTSFEGAGSPQGSSVRHVTQAVLYENPEKHIFFDITANGFLRHMVRNIVGTLVEIGLNRLDPDAMEKIMAARDRSLAGATAPPHGLFLMRVEY